MQHRNTEYCRLPAIYMKETEESRERNSPEVYKNGGRDTERHKYRNKVSPIADEKGSIKSKCSREDTSWLLIVGFCIPV